MLFRFLLDKLFKIRAQSDTEMVKPFLDHLEDLRWTIVKMAVSLVFMMSLCFLFRVQLAALVQQPLHQIELPGHVLTGLQVLNPIDSVSISISLAFYAGIVLSFPFLLYFFAQFVLPALDQQEQLLVLPAVGVGFALFLTGATICFKIVLPGTLRFLAHDAIKMGYNPEWRATDYYGFATQFILVFGLMFELPVVMTVLVKMGIVNAAMLRKTRAYAVVIVFVAAMIIAPSPDPFSMFVVAGPMYLLYEICIWIAWWMNRRDARLVVQAPPEDR